MFKEVSGTGERSLVCLNNGQGRRVDVMRGQVSCLDLTLVSDSLVNACQWQIRTGSSVGSDHFPVLIIVNAEACVQEGSVFTRWCFGKTDN